MKRKVSDEEAMEIIDWLLKEIGLTYADPSRIFKFMEAVKKYDKVITKAIEVAVKPQFRDVVEDVMEVMSIG